MIVGDEPCPRCRENGRDRTGNHLMVFDDGGKYCNRCGYREDTEGKINEDIPLNTIQEINDLPCKSIKSRGLDATYLDYFGVKVSMNTTTGEVEKVYSPRYSEGKLTGFKGKDLNSKDYSKAAGSMKDADLFGQHLYTPGGKLLIITEGELDAVACKQMLAQEGKSYKVVSLPDGASPQGFMRSLEFINSFERVALFFDNDEPGQECAQECAQALPPGKALIMVAPEGTKDANDMLLEKKRVLPVLQAARAYQNEAIISVSNAFRAALLKPPVESLPYPDDWVLMNLQTRGIRLGEIDTWVAGTGAGKSSFTRELIHHISTHPHAQGNTALLSVEEDEDTLAYDLIGLQCNKRLRFIEEREKLSEKEMEKMLKLIEDKVYILKSEALIQGSFDQLFDKIRYLEKYLDVKYMFIDHAHGVVQDLTNKSTDDSSGIDQLLGGINRLKKELNMHFNLLAHTRKTTGGGGKSFEEGAIPTPDDIKGSGAVKQYSSGTFALSRNRLHEDPIVANTTMITNWKCRYTGKTGHADLLYYNENGRLENVSSEFEPFNNEGE